MTWKLFDYIDSKGTNDIKIWCEELKRKDKRQLAKLNQKLDMLMISGPDLPPQLLTDTPSRNIKKIRVRGNLQLRPMLCKGPIDNNSEYTLLFGAYEKGDKFKPKDAVEQADKRRSIITKDPARRIEHERV